MSVKILNNQIFNDVFYVCSMVEYLSRTRKTKHADIVSALGKDNLRWLYKFADVHHCMTFEQVSDDVMERSPLPMGTYDVTSGLEFPLPSFLDIGKVYARLVQSALVENGTWENPNADQIVDALWEVFHSFVCEEISNFNSDLFYDTPSFLYECFKYNKIFCDDEPD